MKKILIHLFPYKFINHDYKIREFAELEKKFKTKVIIHDLSDILYSNFNHVKTKEDKNSIKFKSLSKWVKIFKKLKKKNVVVLNELNFDSFKSLVIHYFLKKSNMPILFDINAGVIDESEIFSKKLNFEKIKIKFFKVLNNPKLFTFFLKKKILRLLFLFIKFNKIIILKAGEEKINLPFRYNYKRIVKVHSRDYSNFLNYKTINRIIKKKPIIFLDGPYPYFKDEEEFFFNEKGVTDIKRWYKEHNIFFDKLESFFSTKVIVIPHPKCKGIENPFFKKRFVDHRTDAALKLTPSSLFVISGIFVSTAISFAISTLKPIFLIYSEQMKSPYKKNVLSSKEVAKIIGCGYLDINNFNKEDILNKMKVNQNLYNIYKNKYLTSKKLLKKPNNLILGNLIEQNFTNKGVTDA